MNYRDCIIGFSIRVCVSSKYNLGIAYRNRIVTDQADNLELAIDAFNQVLIVYTRSEPVSKKHSRTIKQVKKPVTTNILTGYYYSHLKTYKITNQEVKSPDRSHE